MAACLAALLQNHVNVACQIWQRTKHRGDGFRVIRADVKSMCNTENSLESPMASVSDESASSRG